MVYGTSANTVHIYVLYGIHLNALFFEEVKIQTPNKSLTTHVMQSWKTMWTQKRLTLCRLLHCCEFQVTILN